MRGVEWSGGGEWVHVEAQTSRNPAASPGRAASASSDRTRGREELRGGGGLQRREALRRAIIPARPPPPATHNGCGAIVGPLRCSPSLSRPSPRREPISFRHGNLGPVCTPTWPDDGPGGPAAAGLRYSVGPTIVGRLGPVNGPDQISAGAGRREPEPAAGQKRTWARAGPEAGPELWDPRGHTGRVAVPAPGPADSSI